MSRRRPTLVVVNNQALEPQPVPRPSISIDAYMKQVVESARLSPSQAPDPSRDLDQPIPYLKWIISQSGDLKLTYQTRLVARVLKRGKWWDVISPEGYCYTKTDREIAKRHAEDLTLDYMYHDPDLKYLRIK